MGAIKSISLVVLAGVAAAGLTVIDVRAAEFIINSDGGSVTVQEISVEGDQTDLSGVSDATKAQALDSYQSDDFSWGGNDLLDQPLVDSFRLDNIPEFSYVTQKLHDDGYVLRFLDNGQGSSDQ